MTQANSSSRVAKFWGRHSGRIWRFFLRAVLLVLGTLSFLWVLAIGVATLFPSVMPQSFQSACSSETESDFTVAPPPEDKNQTITDYKEKPEPPNSSTSPRLTESLKFNQKCQRTPIPSDNIIAAGLLTVFFFFGAAGSLFPNFRIKAFGNEIEKTSPPAPTEIGAKTANVTDAGAQAFASSQPSELAVVVANLTDAGVQAFVSNQPS